MTKRLLLFACTSAALFSGSAASAAKPVPPSMLQGTRLVSEKFNFAAEAPRFDWVWKMEDEKDGATMFTCEAQGDPLGSIHIYAGKLAPGETIDQSYIEQELKKGLTKAGLQVLGMNVTEVRQSISYNFVASISTQGQTLNAIGIVAVGGELCYIVFHFRLETAASDAFNNFVPKFTLLRDPGLDEAGGETRASSEEETAIIVGALMVLAAIAFVIWLITKLTSR